MKLTDEMYGSHGMSRIRRIHFIGIGGTGMSGIAEVLLKDPTWPAMPRPAGSPRRAPT